MKTTLQEKIAHAESIVRGCLANYKRPIVMSSFGKDSMVLLSIVESVAGTMPPVLFHREPFAPEKYAFANRVIAARGYAVYDYPPSATGVLKANGKLEIMNAYQIGPNEYAHLPTGISPPISGRPFLCGFTDLYSKPVGAFAYPWDLVFIGHKSSDVDPLKGPMPLSVDLKTNVGAPSAAFPLRYFTDADVWRYTEERGLPIHVERYDPENGYREREDTASNPDYFDACTACLDPELPATVLCPKLGAEINNRSQSVRLAPRGLPSYVGGHANRSA